MDIGIEDLGSGRTPKDIIKDKVDVIKENSPDDEQVQNLCDRVIECLDNGEPIKALKAVRKLEDVK